jgi:hypothetical protein
VAVGIEREARAAVAEGFAHDLRMHVCAE